MGDEHVEAHCEHLHRLDARMDEAETDIDELKHQTSEIEKLIARIDTLVSSMQKMYWVIIAALATAAGTWLFTALPPILH
ncbi:MAG: hypothetical protein LKF61_00795 [Eggerthellaceae bacterium]|jgi:chromosome segregation ATPase|nr:hypothetical protein [Eggerthellaceae bacterium]MCH4220494.1 hypothetical protein [Eggerthellaceae bacterium]